MSELGREGRRDEGEKGREGEWKEDRMEDTCRHGGRKGIK